MSQPLIRKGQRQSHLSIRKSTYNVGGSIRMSKNLTFETSGPPQDEKQDVRTSEEASSLLQQTQQEYSTRREDSSIMKKYRTNNEPKLNTMKNDSVENTNYLANNDMNEVEEESTKQKRKKRVKKETLTTQSNIFLQQQPLIAQKRVPGGSTKRVVHTPTGFGGLLATGSLYSVSDTIEKKNSSPKAEDIPTSPETSPNRTHKQKRPPPLTRKSILSTQNSIVNFGFSPQSGTDSRYKNAVSPSNYQRSKTPVPQPTTPRTSDVFGSKRRSHSTFEMRTPDIDNSSEDLEISPKKENEMLLPNIKTTETKADNLLTLPTPKFVVSNPSGGVQKLGSSVMTKGNDMVANRRNPLIFNRSTINEETKHTARQDTMRIPSLVNQSSTQQTIHEILSSTKSGESIGDIREKLESGRYVSMIEMFPNKLDGKNRAIKFQREKDVHLNSMIIEKEYKSITRELDLLKATLSSTNFDAMGGKASDRTKLQSQMEVLEKRKRRLKYYRKLMFSALESWSDYRSQREESELKGEKSSTEATEVLKVDAQRFDEEFRRWRARMSSPAALPVKVREAISNVNAVSTANSMVDRMVQSMRDSRLGSRWRKIDPMIEKEKLTEEIIRWQKRWTPTSSSTVASISDPSASVLSRASVLSSSTAEADPSDLQSSPSHKNHLSPSYLLSSVASSVSNSISVPIDDEVEVVIMNDLNRIADTLDSGFFLTSSTAGEEESDGEVESDDQIKNMLSDMLKQYQVDSDKLMNQMKKKMDKSKELKSLEEEGVKFFVKLDVAESKQFCIGQRYNSRMISDDPHLPTDTPNRSFEDFTSLQVDNAKNNRNIPAVDKSLFANAEPSNQMKPNKGSEEEHDMTIDWSKKIDNGDDDDNVLMDDEDAMPKESSLNARKKLQFTQLLGDLQMQIEHSEKVKSKKRDQPPIRNDWEDEAEVAILDDAGKKKTRKLVVELDDLVGTGGHGKVYRGVMSDTGETVAVKRIPVKNGKIGKKFIKLEIDILRQMTHKNLVKYMGCKYSSKLKEYSVILEYADGGSLEQLIKKKDSLKESLVSKVVYQTLRGLDYLHSKKIIHRDLKPANILITHSGGVKITDFGVSAQLLNIESMRTSCVGTPHYSAPEVIQVLPYSFQADIWSLGCSVYEMLFGHRPYHEMNQVSAMYRMVNDEHPPIPENTNLSNTCRDFLLACWIKDWRKRPTAKELREHAFVAQARYSGPIIWP